MTGFWSRYAPSMTVLSIATWLSFASASMTLTCACLLEKPSFFTWLNRSIQLQIVHPDSWPDFLSILQKRVISMVRYSEQKRIAEVGLYVISLLKKNGLFTVKRQVLNVPCINCAILTPLNSSMMV